MIKQIFWYVASKFQVLCKKYNIFIYIKYLNNLQSIYIFKIFMLIFLKNINLCDALPKRILNPIKFFSLKNIKDIIS